VKQRKENVVPPPPVAVDAGVAAVAVDAATEAETMDVTIRTEPPGAVVQVDGVERGPAPVTIPLVVHDHFFEIIASAPGYEDKTIKVNTYVNKDKLYVLKLKKASKSSPPQQRRTQPTDKPPGDARKPANKTGGELNGNPFNTDAPPKKP
jgi:hypothetical protein